MAHELVVPVIMCTWRRPEYFKRTLKNLAKQRGVRVHLYVWNNNPGIAEYLEKDAADASIEVTFRHSEQNVGGFGRFYFARELVGEYPYVVFIDDDQFFGSKAIAQLAAEAAPTTASSWWAYRFVRPPRYWLRRSVRPGKPAHYIGTCGMVIDNSIFADPRLFECPEEFWFIEDVWLSYVANHLHGWKLTGSAAKFRFKPDLRNQFSGLINDKGRFVAYLMDQGWQLS